jgi:hypothetical protein
VSGFYLYKVRVWNDYPFALRRFVPVTLPLPWASRPPAHALGGPKAGAGASWPPPWPWPWRPLRARDTARIATYVDWRGAVRFVADVARRFGPEDVVVLEQPRSIHLPRCPVGGPRGERAGAGRFNP